MAPIIKIQIDPTPLYTWQLLDEFERTYLSENTTIGACSLFTGKMRSNNENDEVRAMTLEHYPGMTEQQIRTQVNQVIKQYPVDACLVCHRVGEVKPGESLVICATWSAHRAQSFRACEEIFEGLKSNAPFWKKETLSTGESRWVETNTKNPRP